MVFAPEGLPPGVVFARDGLPPGAALPPDALAPGVVFARKGLPAAAELPPERLPPAAAPSAGVATLFGPPLAPGATAQLAPDVAALAPVSFTTTLELEATLTGAWLLPPTLTAWTAVVWTSFWALTPVASADPELEVVTPRGAGASADGVGTSATLTPEAAVAALESVTELVCVLATVSAPLPPPATPAPNWVF